MNISKITILSLLILLSYQKYNPLPIDSPGDKESLAWLLDIANEQSMTPLSDKYFKNFDLNNDNKLTKDEFFITTGYICGHYHLYPLAPYEIEDSFELYDSEDMNGSFSDWEFQQALRWIWQYVHDKLPSDEDDEGDDQFEEKVIEIKDLLAPLLKKQKNTSNIKQEIEQFPSLQQILFLLSKENYEILQEVSDTIFDELIFANQDGFTSKDSGLVTISYISGQLGLPFFSEKNILRHIDSDDIDSEQFYQIFRDYLELFIRD